MLVIGVVAFTAFAKGSVVINELEFNPPEGGTNWVELYNSGNGTMDISEWTVTITDGSWVGKMSVPKGTTISANGFYVAEGSLLWHHDNGGFATLISDSGEVVDKTPYRKDLLNNDFTWARYSSGQDKNISGEWGLAYATKGKPNQIG